MSKLSIFAAVCTLCARTGFRLNGVQVNVLRNWINEGNTDVDQMADAVVCC